MNIFVDTSCLMKLYLNEKGSDLMESYVDKAEAVIISGITRLEGYSTLRRLLLENILNKSSYQTISEEFEKDLKYFHRTVFNIEVEEKAKELIDKYQLKTLDDIQLGSCFNSKEAVDNFISSDKKLIKAAKSEDLKVINPMVIPL